MRVVLHFFSFEEHEEYWFLAELRKAEKGEKPKQNQHRPEVVRGCLAPWFSELLVTKYTSN
jgi:hypothetical protein